MSEQPQPHTEPLVQHDPTTTHYSHPEYNAQQWPPSAGGPGIPPADKRRGFFKKHGMLLGLLAAMFIVAGGLGVGVGRATFDPQVITEVKTETVTKTVTKEVTPKDCITALDLAGDLVGNMSDLAQIGKDGMNAGFLRDATAIKSIGDRLTTLNAKMDKQTGPLSTAVSSCRLKAAN